MSPVLSPPLFHALCTMTLQLTPLRGRIYFSSPCIWASLAICISHWNVVKVMMNCFQAQASRDLVRFPDTVMWLGLG